MINKQSYRTIFLILIVILPGFAYQGNCQVHYKPPVDSAIKGIDNWPVVDKGQISSDGKYVKYVLDSGENKPKITIVQSLDGTWKRSFYSINDFQFTTGPRFIYTRSGDSLWVQPLNNDTPELITGMRPGSQQLINQKGNEKLVYQRMDSTRAVFIKDLVTGKQYSYPGVKEYFILKGKNILVLQRTDTEKYDLLSWVDMETGDEFVFSRNKKTGNWNVNRQGSQIAFMVAGSQQPGKDQWQLWLYTIGNEKAQPLINDHDCCAGSSFAFDSTAALQNLWPIFSETGKFIFFKVHQNKTLSSTNTPNDPVKLDIWNYKNNRLQTQQWKFRGAKPLPEVSLLVLSVKDKKVWKLQQPVPEEIQAPLEGAPDEWTIEYARKNEDSKGYEEDDLCMFAVSFLSGKRTLIMDRTGKNKNLYFSPGSRWLVWYEQKKLSWYSYEWETGITKCISCNISYPVDNENYEDYVKNPPSNKNMRPAAGFAGWMEGGSKALLYDNYDIWAVDLQALQPPVNITGGYGRRNQVKFRIISNSTQPAGEDDKVWVLHQKDSLLLSAFNNRTMENGFYRLQAGNPFSLVKLYMSPEFVNVDLSQLDNMASVGIFKLTFPVFQKALNANVWLVSRQDERNAPNYFYTRDFKTYTQLTDLQPQKRFNWLTTELVHFPLPGGKRGVGILYKPENFTSKNKYPVIFHYYEKKSDRLHQFIKPQLFNGNIDIPYMVSRGYLVFVPDFQYEAGHVGKSALETIVAAAEYLKKIPWINGYKMGLNGQSHGGYETNYIITHSGLFAAAAESAGAVNLISKYNTVGGHDFYEHGQGRIGTTLWKKPGWFIDESPIFRADKVSTPLLIIHNPLDNRVPYSQGGEFFVALQSLHKKVWMLQYDGEDHGVYEDINQRDLTRRLIQYFDHFLKDAPAPKWMTRTSPATIAEGFEPDPTGRCGKDCNVCEKLNKIHE